MKAFRVFVLLLVALLLPIRGAVAATMVCAELGQAGQLATPAAHVHQGLRLDGSELAAGHPHDVAHGHSGHHAHGDGSTNGPADGAGGDTCPICASGCGVAALLMASPTTVGDPPAKQTVFPGVAVPALDFQLDGQDRPPRTI